MKVKIGPYPKTQNDKARTIKIEIDPFDLWALDETLALIIAPALKDFLESAKGYPGNLKSSRKWDNLIEKMYWSFNEIATGNPNEPSIPSTVDILDFEEFFNNPFSKEENLKYTNEYKIYQKKIQEGLNLFAKYFQHLWN